MLSLPLSAILVSLSMCDVYVCVEGGGGENGRETRRQPGGGRGEEGRWCGVDCISSGL